MLDLSPSKSMNDREEITDMEKQCHNYAGSGKYDVFKGKTLSIMKNRNPRSPDKAVPK